MIAAQKGDTAIEVAIDTSISLKTTGLSAIIAAPKGSIDTDALSLDPSDGRLLLSGKPLEYAYCVFSLRQTEQKADFGEIPSLKEKYSILMTAIRSGKLNDAEDALSDFRRSVFTSPDLISSDAQRLIEKAREKVRSAFPGGAQSKRQDFSLVNETLSDIGLYD